MVCISELDAFGHTSKSMLLIAHADAASPAPVHQRYTVVQMGDTVEANKHADVALELAAQAGESDKAADLCRTVWALKVHTSDTGPKAKPIEPKDASPAALADLTVQRVLSKQLTGTADSISSSS